MLFGSDSLPSVRFGALSSLSLSSLGLLSKLFWWKCALGVLFVQLAAIRMKNDRWGHLSEIHLLWQDCWKHLSSAEFQWVNACTIFLWIHLKFRKLLKVNTLRWNSCNSVRVRYPCYSINWTTQKHFLRRLFFQFYKKTKFKMWYIKAKQKTSCL